MAQSRCPTTISEEIVTHSGNFNSIFCKLAKKWRKELHFHWPVWSHKAHQQPGRCFFACLHRLSTAHAFAHHLDVSRVLLDAKALKETLGVRFRFNQAYT
jgi:hypothetical protein